MSLRFALTALMLGATSVAQACFIRSPQPVQVWLDHIHVDIVDQVAIKTYNCTFKNPNARAVVGGTCYMELEPGAQIDNMVVVVNGKETRGEILGVKRANQVFAQMVKEGGSPALLEYYGNQLIQTRIPRIDPNGTVNVKLKYTMVLKQKGGIVRLQMLNTNPKALMQPLQSASVKVNIRSQQPIKNLYSPTHNIKIEETEGWDVSATWSEKNYLPKNAFVLYYQVSQKDVGASLLGFREEDEDGHFMLMLSPTVGKGIGQIKESQILNKDIVFCVDTSGSMLANGKMEQARKALDYCVNHLREGDRFNIVDFSTVARNFSSKGLVKFNKQSKARADRYIEDLAARGGTAIEEALELSLQQLSGDDGRLKMIVFATDGLPTIGTRDPNQILKTVAKLNTHGVRVFVFGEGDDVNTRLLDFLALNHRGEAEYIRPTEDITKKISGFFDRVGSPIMTDMKLEFEGLEVEDIFPRRLQDVYRGEQVIVYGKYREGFGKRTLKLSGTMKGERKTFEYKVDFPKVSEDDKNAFVPRLWAGQKIDFLLTEIRKSEQEDDELIKEVTFLAKRFGIVTPYTSYLMINDSCNQPTPSQVAFFRSQLRDSRNGALGSIAGKYAVQNSWELSRNRRALQSQGAVTNFYAQALDGYKRNNELTGTIVPQQQAMAAVRYVGNRTFYNVKNTWYDSRYDTTQKSQIQEMKIGSEDYLKLLADNPRAAPQMSQGEVVLQLRGQWYRLKG